ncbi:anoctamin-4-like isoform X1 [Dendronephthya gigantea]|uniref:anoctamin-4-like isoform X1 n=1 Tax=Dendronephthya gigantea TaxID=151771 RepID=UPI0010694DDA|nr:anoctamin-4-like isoform X1 [Dendronephthya gigantea]
MSTGENHPSVKYQPKKEVGNDPETNTSSLDEGAILLEHQVQHPAEDDGQNMASPSVNAEPTKNKMRDGKSVVDMVLVYEVPDPSTLDSEKEQQEEEDKRKIRDFYIDGLKAADLVVEIDQLVGAKSEPEDDNENKKDPTVYFVKIHAPWDVCTKMAEEMFLRMPLQESDIKIMSTLETLLGEQLVESIREKNPMVYDTNIIPDDKKYFTAYFTKEHERQFLGVENQETFFSPTDRIRMVERIMGQTPFSENKDHDIGLAKLVYSKAFTGTYPLHDGPCEIPEDSAPSNTRQALRSEWAKFGKWYKFQPLDAIKDYLGTSIGLYFSWLGYYCTMLAPVALIGFIAFLYGVIDSGSYPPVVDCKDKKSNYTMCPLCDKQCWYWLLSDTCTYMQVAHFFDNNFSIAFACIMAIWSTLFLEFWKRQQNILAYKWHTCDFEEVEEQVRPEYAAVVTTLKENPATGRMEPYTPNKTLYKKYAGVFSIVFFMITLVIFAVIAVVVYRAAVFAASASSDDKNVRHNAKVITSMTAAVINLIAINLLKFLYQYVALWLTNWQNPRTQTDWEDSYTIKMYIYQFVNMYSSLFYIAFFKINLFVGTPGHYRRAFGKWRLDGCGPQGCLVELCIQLVIIMVGQQIISNFTEVMIPYLMKLWNERKTEKASITHLPQWEQDYFLPATEGTMFWEYLEVVLQLGFVMMFVAAFPLAPLFAFANGVLEIRVDAINFIRDQRRPSPKMAEDIGAWYPIIDALSSFSVLVNAFVIAFTSDFIAKMVYKYSYSDDGSLDGYLNNSLSYFDTSLWTNSSRPQERYATGSIKVPPSTCRYIGYRETEAGEPYTKQHWQIMAGRFAFIFIFQFSMSFLKKFIAWAIPDMPSTLVLKKKREELIAETKLHQHNDKRGKTYL